MRLNEGILFELSEALEGTHLYDGYLSALCPFHADSRPSLLVFPEYYKCLACGAHGSTKALLKSIKGFIQPRVKTDEAKDVNPFSRWTYQFGSWQKAIIAAAKVIKMKESFYLKGRGIPHNYQKHFHLGWLDDWYTVPIFDKDDKIIGAVARRGETNKASSKYIQPHGQSSELLYIPDWRLIGKRYAYVTFGIFDAIILSMNGLPAMSTISGKNVKPQAFDGFRMKLIFWPDKGEEIEAKKLVAQLGWRASVKEIEWPEGCKDVNDLYIHNREIFYELV